MQFTYSELENLQIPKKALHYRTTDNPGLSLKVTPSGKKTWQLRWRHLGKAKTSNLGIFPEMDFELAKQSAHLMTTHHDNLVRNHPTIQAIADTYARAKNTTAVLSLCSGARRHIIPLLPPAIEDVSPNSIVLACDDIISTGRLKPSTLSGLISFLSRAYRYCAARDEKLPPSPFPAFHQIQKTSEPDTRPIPKPESIRKNLNESELLAFLSHFPAPPESMSGPDAERPRLARLALLTGMRREEIRLLRYSELRLDAEIPHIHLSAQRKCAKGTGDSRPHDLALSSSAINLIGPPPTSEPDIDYVFPHLASLSSSATSKYLTRAGANPHRLRFTLANRLGRIGCPEIVAARILSHATKTDAPAVTVYYMAPEYDHMLPEQLLWLERLSAYLGL